MLQEQGKSSKNMHATIPSYVHSINRLVSCGTGCSAMNRGRSPTFLAAHSSDLDVTPD